MMQPRGGTAFPMQPRRPAARWRAIVRDLRAARLAQRRADGLLAATLSDGERAQLRRDARLDVPSRYFPARVYRIPKHPGLIEVREGGVTTMYLRAWPEESLPRAAQVLWHKLWLEGDEGAYLRMAEVLPPLLLHGCAC